MDPPPSSSQVTCVLRLDTQTSGWDKSMHKLFKGIRDVTYTIDATRGLAYLSGKISPEIILRIRKAKKHAELIHMDYGHVNPPPLNPANPFEIAPISFNYPDPRPPPPYLSPMYQPTAPPYLSPMYQPPAPMNQPPAPMNQPPAPMNQPPAPMNQYMYYSRNPYIEQPPVASPYYYYPYFVPEVLYSPPPQLPTRDGVTGEQQCRIL